MKHVYPIIMLAISLYLYGYDAVEHLAVLEHSLQSLHNVFEKIKETEKQKLEKEITKLRKLHEPQEEEEQEEEEPYVDVSNWAQEDLTNWLEMLKIQFEELAQGSKTLEPTAITRAFKDILRLKSKYVTLKEKYPTLKLKDKEILAQIQKLEGISTTIPEKKEAPADVDLGKALQRGFEEKYKKP